MTTKCNRVFCPVNNFVVELELLENTNTDPLIPEIMSEKNRCARYYCDKFKVIDIREKITNIAHTQIPDFEVNKTYQHTYIKTPIYFDRRVALFKDLDTSKYTGEYCSWYDDGQQYAKCYFENGQYHGEFITWHPNGQIQCQRFYNHGKEIDEYKSCYGNGKLEYLIKWENENKQVTHYHRNGNLHYKYNYKNNIIDGENKEWYENGLPSRESYYINDKEESFVREWFRSGPIFCEYFCVGGNIDGLRKIWFLHGRLQELSMYKNGKKDGWCYKFYASGKIKSCICYANGRKCKDFN
ncbi:MAG: hypothetical protein Dasosvirus3_33 [Dasosvirus sp.]|uniref:MORN-repeat protein n=1 Tax=Dasosvirus sp. TaxID=2487764 RepID=A0A3G4ZT31_9VIRU|nr:MAG: hypothetical protein Dasosvirus3_33 [Dasosvirus sp.]